MIRLPLSQYSFLTRSIQGVSWFCYFYEIFMGKSMVTTLQVCCPVAMGTSPVPGKQGRTTLITLYIYYITLVCI